jgi:hypothetical protein
MLFSRKVQAAIVAGLVFFVLSSPLTYGIVDTLVGGVLTTLIPSLAPVFRVAQQGCPTTYGIGLHALAFAIVSYVLMGQ